MKQQTLFLSTALLALIGMSVIPTANARPYPADFEFSEAQGDGDPTELTAEELITTQTVETKTVQITETEEADVAQLTAEGDFIVPTFLLPTESEIQTPVITVSQTITTPAIPIAPVMTTTAPVTVIPPKQAAAAQNKPATSDKQTAPVLVLQGNPTPQNKPVTPAVAVPKTAAASNEIATSVFSLPQVTMAQPQLVTPVVKPQPTQKTEQQPSVPTVVVSDAPADKPLLLPLAPIIDDEVEQLPAIEHKKRFVVPSTLADNLLNSLQNNMQGDFMLPYEIKISFYRNSTALSGQTLKWIKAFALQTVRDPRRVVEIRVSQENPIIQAKRLAVIKNALLGSGLSLHQMQITYTNRPSDSFVIRAAERMDGVQLSQKTTASGKTIEKRTIKW